MSKPPEQDAPAELRCILSVLGYCEPTCTIPRPRP